LHANISIGAKLGAFSAASCAEVIPVKNTVNINI
jgi:hypothetical protein